MGFQGGGAVFNNHCGERSVDLRQAAFALAAHNCAIRVLHREVTRVEQLHTVKVHEPVLLLDMKGL
eukprot:3429914-Prorocentrum_lima.AAC.1